MTIEELRTTAKSMIDRLTRERADNTDGKAKALIKTLRDERQFELLIDLAAAYGATGAYDPEIAGWNAQALIETGKAAKARELLTDLAARVPAGSKAFIEAKGLLGRAWKQTFFDSPDNSSGPAHEAINQAVMEYKACFDAEPGGSVWAGVNLLALAAFAKRKAIPTAIAIEPRALALQMLAKLDATPNADRDNWYRASRAEAYLGTGSLDDVELQIGVYVRSKDTTAFALGGTLRQFTQLWQLDQQGDQGLGIVKSLRAALMKTKENGHLELSSKQIQQSLATDAPSDHQLQVILGSGGQAAYKWWSLGVRAARSVGVIGNLAGKRMGTGFLVRGGDFISALGDELIVMTNAHVVSDPPVEEALAVDIACIVFEAVDIQREYKFKKVLWQSGLQGCDCTLLRLQEQPADIKPLEISGTMTIPPIPRPEGAPRPLVYIIGYPGGRELTFSFQDNDLLDHEAPPAGKPPKPDVCYFHYRAPTEGGSSGSPVFEPEVWRVISLHHAGGENRKKLNGKDGTEPANEGIWIQSIVKAVAAADVQV